MGWSYTCFNCEDSSPEANSSEYCDILATKTGWVIGHCDGQGHYACPECSTLLFDPLPIIINLEAAEAKLEAMNAN